MLNAPVRNRYASGRCSCLSFSPSLQFVKQKVRAICSFTRARGASKVKSHVNASVWRPFVGRTNNSHISTLPQRFKSLSLWLALFRYYVVFYFILQSAAEYIKSKAQRRMLVRGRKQKCVTTWKKFVDCEWLVFFLSHSATVCVERVDVSIYISVTRSQRGRLLENVSLFHR